MGGGLCPSVREREEREGREEKRERKEGREEMRVGFTCLCQHLTVILILFDHFNGLRYRRS